jgi:hypothetical protein
MRDPKVIDPPGFDPKAGWQECREYVDKCGGLAHEDGEVNWRAAAGADPGVCSCPNCGEMYWSWGRIVECLDCAFQFPTDWWAMYSWGVQAATRNGPAYRQAERMEHPYYRYGFEHPVEDPWEQHDKLPWKEIMAHLQKTQDQQT